MIDPHDVLGVEQGADEKRLLKRYRKVCKMFHPDKHDNDRSAVTIFQLVQKSYNALVKSKEKIQLPIIPYETKDKQEEHKKKENKTEPIVPGTNITENDIRIIGEKINDPWFHPSFSLADFFGDVAVPDKKNKK
jgi:curved DNA-binding protein CbpA